MLIKWIKEIWAGILVGAANIIPGVSGGTLLFLLRLYERTISAVSKFKDLPYLARLLGGAGLAILMLSGLMEYLLEKQFANTYAFFFGLIAMSAVMSIKMLKAKKPVFLIHLIIGAALTIAITALDNPLENAQTRSDRYKARAAVEAAAQASSPMPENGQGKSETRLKYTGQYSVKDFTAAAICGAAAISAMVLPGLSGSLVLILLGQYQEVISAISNLKTLQLDYFAFLSIMAVGMGLGLLVFARAVEFVFKRYYNGTIAFLIGLMVGSLYALWPFKRAAVMVEQYVKDGGAITVVENAVIQTNINILPGNAVTAVFALLLCAAGVGIMVVLEKYGKVEPE